VLGELRRAEARLPHVSRGYFITRWKAHQLPPPGQERDVLVQQLVDAGLAEEFEVTSPDGRLITAIRSRDGGGPRSPGLAAGSSAPEDALGESLDGAGGHLGPVA
jgi:hypothetical protein